MNLKVVRLRTCVLYSIAIEDDLYFEVCTFCQVVLFNSLHIQYVSMVDTDL